MASRVVILMLMFTFVSVPQTFGSPNPESQQPGAGYDVAQSDRTVPSPAPPPVFDLGSVSPAAKQRLLPLYRQAYRLLQELSRVRLQALSDTLVGLANIGAASLATPTTASSTVQESAAVAGQYGAR